jgi:ABC-2 type transport system ATP-binding protein
MFTLARRNLKEAKKEFIEKEKDFNLSFQRSKKIKQFSAGERKILSTLMILVLKPEVIFFDEPTANLDLQNKKIILKIISLLKSPDRIIVITTHLIDEVKELLTDLVILDQGIIKYTNLYQQEEDLKLIFDQNTTISNVNYESLEKSLT